MSVRIVNNKHIDALVSYALDHGLLTYSDREITDYGNIDYEIT